MQNKIYKPYLAFHLSLSALFLILLGIVAIYAASAFKSNHLYDHPYQFLYKQGFGLALGCFVFFLIQSIPFSWLEKLTLPLLFLSMLLSALIFVPKLYHSVGGASRWLRIGFFSFQPSEVIKISMLFFLSKNLSRKTFDGRSFKFIVSNLLVLFFFLVCLMKQPDFGTSVLIMSVTFVMLFIAGLSWKYISLTMVFSCLAFSFAVISEPYRIKRLLSFLDPWSNSSAGGFQIIQSYLAFKNGGFWGLGLGQSKQKLFFLPEAHTDFILSVIAEELGLFGVILTVLFFLYMITLGLEVSKKQKNSFKKFLAFGISSLIALQAIMNIGVVIGLFPTKGISLPFVSSGVSSLLSFIFCISVLIKIARITEKEHRHGKPS